MTVHVIDPSRPVPPTYEDGADAFFLNDGDTLILTEGAELAAYGAWAFGIWGGYNNTLLINGNVHSEQAVGIVTQGIVTIGTTGSVTSRDEGVYLLNNPGLPNVLINAGTIAAGMAGVVIEGSQGIVSNSGTIIGNIGILFWDHDGPNENLVVNNTGQIAGTSDVAIYGVWEGNNSITNSGRIDGDIVLGYRSDIYDGRGGIVTGVIDLMTGDDVAYGGTGTESFLVDQGRKFIDGGDGIDTLEYVLAATVDLRITERQQTGNESWGTIRNIENLSGSAFDDRFIGNATANTFIGNAGNDTLIGYDGNDLLSGGAGDDLLQGGLDSDTAIFTGKFSDYTITVDGAGVTITDKRASGDGVDHLLGVEFAIFSDRIYTIPTVPKPPAPPAPVVKNLTLNGNSRANNLVGGKGHDALDGGYGNDKLTGSVGKDAFSFTTKLGRTNVDYVTDFRAADDVIKLSKAVFGGLQKGWLGRGAFHQGTKAHDGDDRIIYDAKSGSLYLDADGSGAKYGQVKFAQLKAGTALAAADFLVI